MAERKNKLGALWYAVLHPARTWEWEGKTYHEPAVLMSASKTNMPALYMSRKVAENHCPKGSSVIIVKVVEAS